MLARSIVTATDDWVESARELLHYLAEDFDALQDAFSVGGELGSLIAISGNAGDVHRRGRSVAIAEFSSGIRVVFKPRPLDVDRHFVELVAWINGLGHAPKLRAVQVLTEEDDSYALMLLLPQLVAAAEAEAEVTGRPGYGWYAEQLKQLEARTLGTVRDRAIPAA